MVHTKLFGRPSRSDGVFTEQQIENFIIWKINAYSKHLVSKNTDIDMTNRYRVQNIADPIDGKYAANKAYVDDIIRKKLENEAEPLVLRPT